MPKYYEAVSESLIPSNYTLSIFAVDLSTSTFLGKVSIDLAANDTADYLELNYRDLIIDQLTVQITANGSPVLINSILFNEKKESFKIIFDSPIAKGSLVFAAVEYSGIIQSNMAGFYKSTYKQGIEDRVMLATQFEATDARRAFPCLDEPEFKATFQVSVTIRDDWTVLGNTVVKSTIQLPDNLKKITFETTPKMSTYLLAWVCGEFEYTESYTKLDYQNGEKLPVRIYTTPGYIKEAEFALEIAPKIVDYFLTIFEIKYPLLKLDLIAVHAFSHNAMENWGLITYRSTALLFNPEKSAPLYKQKVCYVVAHEIAHQWFGDLVTMQWWDELWLNEGFATFAGYAAVDYLFPEWNIFATFINDSQQFALALDGLKNSHPIEVPVKDALDIDQVFDAISYLKGALVIQMISSFLGRDIFFKGVALYLKRNRYANATTKELWAAIEDVSGKPISDMMHNWITKIGFPVVNVSIDSHSGRLKVSQDRFLNSGDVKPEENETKWWIPLNMSTGPNELDSEAIVLQGKSQEFDLNGKDFFKLNKDTTGFFRVYYSPEVLSKYIFPKFDQLSALDKTGLLCDVKTFSQAGIIEPSVVLNLIKLLCDSDELKDDYTVWQATGSAFSSIYTTFVDMQGELINFAKYIYGKKSMALITSKPVDFVENNLRRLLLENGLEYEIDEVCKYAEHLFENWRQTGKAADSSLRSFVLSHISSSSLMNNEIFDWMMQDITNPTTLDSREITLAALGNTKNPELIERLLNSILDPQIVPTMDAHYLGVTLAKNKHSRDVFWEFFKANYDTFYKIMSTNMVVLDRFIGQTLGLSHLDSRADDIESFFSDKDIHGFERSYAKVIDSIRSRAKYYQKGSASIKNWLEENKF